MPDTSEPNAIQEAETAVLVGQNADSVSASEEGNSPTPANVTAEMTELSTVIERMEEIFRGLHARISALEEKAGGHPSVQIEFSK
jgi:hypothetical protein